MTKLIIALDVNNKKDLHEIVQKTEHLNVYYKVGMELYFSLGEYALDFLSNKSLPIFLDLKLHDIPSTVHKAIKSLLKYNVKIINVHALGGRQMLTLAKQALDRRDIKLIAVTHLTSLCESEINNELGINNSIKSSVLNLAKLSNETGLDGVVCSAHEVEYIKKHTREDFICVTPGIRFTSDSISDQKRVMTPLDAYKSGSDFIVMGRSITRAKSIEESAIKALKEINEYC